MNIFNAILDFIFPRQCVGCKKTGSYICAECLKKISFLKYQNCPYCRRKNVSGCFCDKKCAANFFFDQLIVCISYEHESLFQKLIVQFKYKFSEELTYVLGNILKSNFDVLQKMIPYNRVFLVPVPIHKKKLKSRGFNQSKLLAEFLIGNTGLHDKTTRAYARRTSAGLELCDCLYRKIYRPDQAKLSRNERLVNLIGAIDIKDEYKNLTKGRFIFLIDDVATTGSTLNECSKILKKYGARHICCIVLARGK